MEKKGKIKVKKKGELTSSQIVMFAMAIIAFIIVLIFLVVVKDLFQTDEEACRLSVLTRATSPETVQGYVPLKCKTGKICLTDGSGKGECENEFAGEEITKVSLPSDPTAAARIIEETSANAFYDCWSMMGKGRLSVGSKGVYQAFGVEKTAKSCVICSRVAIQHKEKDKLIGSISNDNKKTFTPGLVDVNRYMANTQVPGSALTYLQTFTDKQFKTFPVTQPITQLKGGILDIDLGNTDKTKTLSGDTSETVIMFSQIKPNSYQDVLKALGLVSGIAVAGGGYVMGPINTVKRVVDLATSPKQLALTLVTTGAVGAIAMSNVYEGRVSAAGFCGKVTTTLSEADASNGCSAVQMIPYDVAQINSMCDIIEGTP